MIDYIARFNGSLLTPVHRCPKLNSNGLEIWAIKVASSHDISKWSIILKRIAVRSYLDVPGNKDQMLGSVGYNPNISHLSGQTLATSAEVTR